MFAPMDREEFRPAWIEDEYHALTGHRDARWERERVPFTPELLWRRYPRERESIERKGLAIAHLHSSEKRPGFQTSYLTRRASGRWFITQRGERRHLVGAELVYRDGDLWGVDFFLEPLSAAQAPPAGQPPPPP